MSQSFSRPVSLLSVSQSAGQSVGQSISKAAETGWIIVCLSVLSYTFDTETMLSSLHRSLSQEESLRDQFNQTMTNFESRLRARDVDIQQAQQSYDEVVAKLKAVSQERKNLAKQLEESSKNRRREKERADK